MASFGEKLKAAREDRGIELSDVSAATNVGVHLLEALEANEFARLPGGPFNKGFVRAYARHIGIDPEEAVSAYAREERSQGIRTPDVEREMPRAETRLIEFRDDGDQVTLVLDWAMVKRILMGAGALVLLMAATWLLWPAGESGQDQGESPAAIAPSQPAAIGEPSQAQETIPENDPAPGNGAEPPATPAAQAEDTPPPPDPAPENREPAPTRPEPQVAATPPPPDPEPAVESDPSSLEVIDFGVGTGVSQRQLTGRADSFSVGTQVWFWTRTLGGKKDEILEHVWLREGRPVMTYQRTLGGPHWRNSSRKTLSPGSEGHWAVEARDAQGRVVARTSFDCTAK